jgi:glycerophosphoryl diester phosphodiesterase
MPEAPAFLRSSRPRVVGHRGARSLAPENTMASFRKAAELGADAIECDVQLSRDGVPVVFHDFTLERCTDFAARPKASPFLADWTLDELRALDAGSWYAEKDPFGQIRAGHVGEAELAGFRGERIPTLDELLEFCREARLPLVLEIKQQAVPSDELVERCVRALRSHGLVERSVVISFDHPSLLLARRIEPELSTGALLVSRLADPGRYARETLGAQLVSVYCPERVFLRARPEETYIAQDVRSAHEAGIGYHVWTVNQEADFPGLVQAGVDGIATDFPQTLLEALAPEPAP